MENSADQKHPMIWQELVINKEELLYRYDLAQTYPGSRCAQEAAGDLAGACYRNWLAKMLPGRFGVSAACIASPLMKTSEEFLFRNVVIYDRMNAPVLWLDTRSGNGHCSRVPVLLSEYVHAILEVRPVLTTEHARETMARLEEVQQKLLGKPRRDDRSRDHLPQNFSMGVIFFDLHRSEEYDETILNTLIPESYLRGYFGGLILRGEGLDPHATCLLKILVSQTPMKTYVGENQLSLLQPANTSDSIRHGDRRFYSIGSSWSDTGFSSFTFDLIAYLNGTLKNW